MAIQIAHATSLLATVTFRTMTGPVNPSGPMMKEISAEGVAGAAFMRYAFKGERFRIQTMEGFANVADLAIAKILYLRYQTQPISLTDALGNTWANLYVWTVRITNEQKITAGVGQLAGKTHILEAEWEIQSAAVSY